MFMSKNTESGGDAGGAGGGGGERLAQRSRSLSLSFPFLFAAAVFALLHPLILFFSPLSPPLIALSKHSRLITLLHISLSQNLPCSRFFYLIISLLLATRPP